LAILRKSAASLTTTPENAPAIFRGCPRHIA
jgi:hypothetical protein